MRTPFVFDMTSRDALMQSLCSFFGLSEEKIEDFILMNEDVSLKSFCRTMNITEEQLKLPDLYLASYHCTTSMDRCTSLQTLGILNLREALRQDTPISRYLRERGVIFDLANKTVQRLDTVFDLRNNYGGVTPNRAKDIVAYKIYNDHQVNGFLCTDDVLKYGGYVHLRPEFFIDVAELFNDPRLLSDWENDPNRQAYVLKFIAPLADYNPATFSIHQEFVAVKTPEEIEKMKVHDLLSRALRTLRDCMILGQVNEDRSFLNGDASVPPQNIIQIFTAESYTKFNETAW